jgi:dephospho-CoA kinase
LFTKVELFTKPPIFSFDRMDIIKLKWNLSDYRKISAFMNGRFTVSRWANKYVIGLTGNIGTGKSVVRQMLQHLGAYTIDADSLTHRAMAPGAPAYKPVIDTFGQFILDSEKNINRAMLGNIVFSHPDALAKLEAIVHPIVLQAIGTLITRATQRVVVIEAIKLVDTDMGKAVDAIWVVDASPETQYRRLTGPRKMSEAEAKQRIAAQTPQADKLAKANLVIKNDGNVEETWKQVQDAWNALQLKLAGAAPGVAAAPPQPAAQPVSAPPAAPAAPVSRPAAPPPQPAAQAPAAPAQPVQPVSAPAQPSGPLLDVKATVRRGMPSNAEAIASFINASAAKGVSRMDIMMAFGQKSYLLAQAPDDQMLGLMGWQVENLITRVDEFYLAPNVVSGPIIEALLTAVEAASKDLQSEVAYIFLPGTITQEMVQSFAKSGYEVTEISQIKIPAWREAVQEILSENKNARIMTKRLREDRVLKPI